MFHEFSAAASRRPSTDLLQEVQEILNSRGMTFGTLITSALRDPTSSFGTTMVTEIPDILEALRPYFNQDDKARASLGEFFASVTAPELSPFEKDHDEISWHLPAAHLSTDQILESNLEKMWKRIDSDAPALSSFLTGICGGSKPGGCEQDIRMDVDEGDADEEEDSEFGMKARQRVSPVRLAEIRKMTLAGIILNVRNMVFLNFL
ncbi:hypothetical protein BJ322DRAFT_1106721 [Thelephora terrestris]|uniref:Uncharacterized protein n=1 Tax=Thelephora terrestris TaxID=56493 RepID=A0A9P6HLM2_9AGAM|nr:hypothetical protein BJ322DRAFT_1106721 [Thelephora terrestris]